MQKHTTILIVDNRDETTQEVYQKTKSLWPTVDFCDLYDDIDPNQYMGVILSLKDNPNTANPLYQKEKDWIATAQVPVLATGGGLQLVASCYGTATNPMHRELTGKHKVHTTQNCPLFKNLYTEISVYKKQRYQLQSLPPNFEQVAWSFDCSIDAMQHLFRPVFATQFYPEKSPQWQKILGNFVFYCITYRKKQTTQAAFSPARQLSLQEAENLHKSIATS